MANSNTGNPSWPDRVDNAAWAREQTTKLHEMLAVCLGSLDASPHSDDYPDLRGQVFQVLTDATFDLLIADDPAAVRVFAMLLAEADVMRGRVINELAGREATTVGKFAAEPWVALMELSGCALVMSRATGKGQWSEIKVLWSALVASPDFGTDRLLAALAISSDLMFGTPGGLIRLSRINRLEDALGSLGYKHWGYDAFSDSETDPAQDPLVSAFAPGDMRVRDELEDAFAVEFLAPLLDDPASLPRRARELMDTLRRRDRRTKQETKNGTDSLGGSDALG